MVSVQEIPKGRDPGTYFSSLHNLNPTTATGRNNARAATPQTTDNKAPNSDNTATRQPTGPNKRKRVNYNVQQIQAEQFLTAKPKSKSLGEELETEILESSENGGRSRENTILLAELKRAHRRFEELNRENYNENVRVEIPKNVTGLIVKRNTTTSAAVKRLLLSKKTWSNFLDELNKNEVKLISTGNSPLEVKPNALQLEKLCTICGGVSYSSCIKCRVRVCSVKCQHVHDETRCTHF